MSEHHDGCWREHHECAIRRVEQLDRQLLRYLDGRPWQSCVMSCGHTMWWPASANRPAGPCWACLQRRLQDRDVELAAWRQAIGAVRRRIARLTTGRRVHV